MRTKHTFRLPPDLATKVDRLRRAQGRDAVLGRRGGAGVPSLAGRQPIAWRPRWRDAWTGHRGRSSGSKGTSAFPMRRWRCSSDFGSRARGHCRTRPWRRLEMGKGAPDRTDHRPEVSAPGPV